MTMQCISYCRQRDHDNSTILGLQEIRSVYCNIAPLPDSNLHKYRVKAKHLEILLLIVCLSTGNALVSVY